MTRKEAVSFVRASDGNICIRYIADPISKQPIFSDQLFQITRRTRGLTAGIMAASFSLSTLAYAQEESPSPVPTDEVPAVVEIEQDTEQTGSNDQQISTPEEVVTDKAGSIEGTIWDDNGQPVSGVELNLVNAETSEYAGSETTDRKGHYVFKDLEGGIYLLRIYSATGLKKAMREMTLTDGQKYIQNLHVKVIEPPKDDEIMTGSGFGGAMAVIPYSLPLSKAVANNDIDETLDLIAKGASINGKDENFDDITPLFLAVENGNIPMVKLLLENGADVNARDKTDRTPIMFIDGDATPDLIELLIRAGAKINAKDKDGNTVLLHGIWSLKIDTVNALIKAGADVNHANDEGDTPVIKAAIENKLDLVKALVLAGADVNARNRRHESAWDITSNIEVEKVLEEYGAVTDYGNFTVFKSTPRTNDGSNDDTEENDQ